MKRSSLLVALLAPLALLVAGTPSVRAEQPDPIEGTWALGAGFEITITATGANAFVGSVAKVPSGSSANCLKVGVAWWKIGPSSAGTHEGTMKAFVLQSSCQTFEQRRATWSTRAPFTSLRYCVFQRNGTNPSCGDLDRVGASPVVTSPRPTPTPSESIRDTEPPIVKAVPHGETRPGRTTFLEFQVLDDTEVDVHLGLYEGGRSLYRTFKGFSQGPVRRNVAPGSSVFNVQLGWDLKGPLYFCVWGVDAAGNKSERAPRSSCAWIDLYLDEIAKVSNGCGGGGWEAFVKTQNYFGNKHSYLNSNFNPTADEYYVNFVDACNLHDAGYGGYHVWDRVRQHAINYRSWLRDKVDSKFLADMRYACIQSMPDAKIALEKCKSEGGDASIGAETLYNFVHKWGDYFYDWDLTVEGRQGTPQDHRDGFR